MSSSTKLFLCLATWLWTSYSMAVTSPFYFKQDWFYIPSTQEDADALIRAGKIKNKEEAPKVSSRRLSALVLVKNLNGKTCSGVILDHKLQKIDEKPQEDFFEVVATSASCLANFDTGGVLIRNRLSFGNAEQVVEELPYVDKWVPSFRVYVHPLLRENKKLQQHYVDQIFKPKDPLNNSAAKLFAKYLDFYQEVADFRKVKESKKTKELKRLNKFNDKVESSKARHQTLLLEAKSKRNLNKQVIYGQPNFLPFDLAIVLVKSGMISKRKKTKDQNVSFEYIDFDFLNLFGATSNDDIKKHNFRLPLASQNINEGETLIVGGYGQSGFDDFQAKSQEQLQNYYKTWTKNRLTSQTSAEVLLSATLSFNKLLPIDHPHYAKAKELYLNKMNKDFHDSVGLISGEIFAKYNSDLVSGFGGQNGIGRNNSDRGGPVLGDTGLVGIWSQVKYVETPGSMPYAIASFTRLDGIHALKVIEDAESGIKQEPQFTTDPLFSSKEGRIKRPLKFLLGTDNDQVRWSGPSLDELFETYKEAVLERFEEMNK